MSKKQAIRYRDTVAAPGSDLHTAIIDTKEAASQEGRALASKRAENIYNETQAAFKLHNPNWTPFP